MMKKISAFLILLSVLGISEIFGWGFFGHRKINYMAVFTLPPAMFDFYKRNIDYIQEHAVDPDKRRYAVAEEAARHYIDLEHYSKQHFDIFPLTWEEAVKKFTEDTLQAYGIVPWYVLSMYHRLIKAFSDKDGYKILRISTDLGHYIADAHVPLHCTENYNGQLTNQHGIHAFWESRLPELFYEDYDFFTGKAKPVIDPYQAIWNVVKQSYLAKDSVLQFEAELNEQSSPDNKYMYEQRGNTTQRTYSREYSAAYHKSLDGQVERRMRESIIMIGSFWMTAWIMAGEPDLSKISGVDIPDEQRKQMEEEDRMWRTGKVKNNKGHADD